MKGHCLPSVPLSLFIPDHYIFSFLSKLIHLSIQSFFDQGLNIFCALNSACYTITRCFHFLYKWLGLIHPERLLRSNSHREKCSSALPCLSFYETMALRSGSIVLRVHHPLQQKDKFQGGEKQGTF